MHKQAKIGSLTPREPSRGRGGSPARRQNRQLLQGRCRNPFRQQRPCWIQQPFTYQRSGRAHGRSPATGRAGGGRSGGTSGPSGGTSSRGTVAANMLVVLDLVARTAAAAKVVDWAAQMVDWPWQGSTERRRSTDWGSGRWARPTCKNCTQSAPPLRFFVFKIRSHLCVGRALL